MRGLNRGQVGERSRCKQEDRTKSKGGVWAGGQIGGMSEQWTGRRKVYSKQEDRTKSEGEAWTGGQVEERSEKRTVRRGTCQLIETGVQ